MSDHDPNGNDDFRNKRVNFGQPKYDLSATQPMRKNTMMYSMVDAEEAKRRHGGSSQVSGTAPTEEMPALEELHITTVKMIVSQIIENDIPVSYTHLRCRRIERCRSRWSPYH